jgi:Rod binding domain-containing protein
MSVAPVSASPAAAAQQLADLANIAPASSRRLTGAALRNASPEEQRKQVAQQFEAILVRQLLSSSVGSMLGGKDNTAGSIYGDLLTNTLADQLTAGQGFGFARLVERQLAPHGAAAAAVPSAPTAPSL